MKVQPNLGRSWIVALMLALIVALSPVLAVAESPAATGSQGDVSGLQTGPVIESRAQPAGPAVSDDWWSAAQEYIRASEYHVTWQETTYLDDVPEAYQAPNRAHNLRTYFTPDGKLALLFGYCGLTISRHALPLAGAVALSPGDNALDARRSLGHNALERLERDRFS